MIRSTREKGIIKFLSRPPPKIVIAFVPPTIEHFTKNGQHGTNAQMNAKLHVLEHVNIPPFVVKLPFMKKDIAMLKVLNVKNGTKRVNL